MRMIVCLFIVTSISGRCFAFDAGEFPEQLGDLTRGQIQQFDRRLPGAGYMVQYQTSGIGAAVYVYDRGLASIPEATCSPLIFQELGKVMEDVHLLAMRRVQENITIIRENLPGRCASGASDVFTVVRNIDVVWPDLG